MGQNTILLGRNGNAYGAYKQYSITPADLITRVRFLVVRPLHWLTGVP